LWLFDSIFEWEFRRTANLPLWTPDESLNKILQDSLARKERSRRTAKL